MSFSIEKAYFLWEQTTCCGGRKCINPKPYMYIYIYMQCVAVCCSVLQWVVVCCSVQLKLRSLLRMGLSFICVAVFRPAVQSVPECCSVLQCVAVCCSMSQRIAVYSRAL